MIRFSFLFFILIQAAAVARQPTFKTILSDVPSSIRGLSVVDDRVAWFSGSKGYVGRTTNGGKTWKYSQVKFFEKLDFRSLYAFDSLHAIVANAGSPASILKTLDGGKTWKEVYHRDHPDIFLDGIDFWDRQTGLIYGDPIDGKMVLIKTTDSGETWKDVSSGQSPTLERGEASFAASGTGIRCYEKNKAVIATGGLVSRLWVTQDGGAGWSFRTAPMVQGKNSTGIFSVGANRGLIIIVGGDFVADSLSSHHVYCSKDEGKNWVFPKTPTRGYRSCVEFIFRKTWIAVGQGGLDLSEDNGMNWKSFSDVKGLHVVRMARKGAMILAAGNGKVVSVLLNRD